MMHYGTLALFIDGEWISNGRVTEEVKNPATGQTIGHLPHATAVDLDRALAAAERAFIGWRDMPAFQRSEIMLEAVHLIKERSQTIAEIIVLEQGKPISEARGEVLRAAGMIEFCAQEARRSYGRVIPSRETNVQSIVHKVPVGPIAGFSPWNFPAISPARKIGGALAAGCSLILKPSEEVPATAVALAQAFADAGLPSGVLNIVFGDPAAVSEHLIASPIIRKISFTGSVPVGKHLAKLAAASMKPAVMELGGHGPVIIFPDTDLQAAAKASAMAKFRNAGQVCISPTRFYVHRSVFELFKDMFLRTTEAIRVGDPALLNTQMGPLINERRLQAMERLVGDAVRRGADLLCGGKRIGNAGHFFAPTVLANVPDGAEVLTSEPFGPLALIQPFTATHEAIADANALPFGLAAYAFTRSAENVALVSKHLEAGVIGINRFGISEPETPFGGIKDSGYGREGGIEGLDSYCVTKFVAHAA